MIKAILFDIKRGISEPTFYLALAIIILLLIMSGVYYFSGVDTYTADEAFKAIHSIILPFFAPILVCLPYSNMSMIEKDSGYEQLILNKISYPNYVMMRFISNAIVGGLTLFIPISMAFIVCRFISSYNDLGDSILLVICLNFLFGMSYSTMAYGLTFFNDKSYIPTILPQVVYLLLTYAIPYLNLDRFYPPLAFSPWLLVGSIDIRAILIQNLVLLIFGCCCAVVGILRRSNYKY